MINLYYAYISLGRIPVSKMAIITEPNDEASGELYSFGNQIIEGLCTPSHSKRVFVIRNGD